MLFSVFVDYILAQSNVTLDFDCIERVSNSLPVTITDMDGVVLIPLYNMRTGIDLEKFAKKSDLLSLCCPHNFDYSAPEIQNLDQ